MPKYLLDTNACIAIRNAFRGGQSRDAARRAAQERLIAKWQGMPATDLAMSFVSLGELALWAEKHADAPQARAQIERLASSVQVLGVPSVEEVGCAKHVASHYGAIRAALERRGERIGGNDLWIAAHATALGMTVVTGNTGEFARVPGLAVEDWSAA